MQNPTEWVKKLDDGTVKVGLTDYAQHELGDLVFINLPQEGDEVSVGETLATWNRSKRSLTCTALSPAPSPPSTKNCWTTPNW